MASPTPLTVMVPLGGIGSRFQKEGYASPKPFINVLGKPMILWVLDNLKLEPSDELVIVYNPAFLPTKYFQAATLSAKYPKLRLVELPGPTRGAAETVLIGLRGLDEEVRSRPVMLVDGDSFYGDDIVGKYREHCRTDNGVFYFTDTQPKPMYSYIKFGEDCLITEVKEKVKISDNANSGCYCFSDGNELRDQCQALLDAGETQLSQDKVAEYYTSGVIAAMIDQGKPFRAIQVRRETFHVLGTPAQVEAFCRTWKEQPAQRICFDLDGTLVSDGGRAIDENVAACRELHKQGHTIVVSTSRPAAEGEATTKMLKDLDIPCDELVFDKIGAQFYVDAKALSPFRDLHKEIGFYPGSLPCTNAGEGGGPTKKQKTGEN